MESKREKVVNIITLTDESNEEITIMNRFLENLRRIIRKINKFL